MTIYLGSDHGGFQLKGEVKSWLSLWGYLYKDVGAVTLDPQDDYPQFAFAVATQVSKNEHAKGILLCRSGGGMAIAANRILGIRAVEVHDVVSARHAREHNDSNILVLEADWIDSSQVKIIVKTWLVTQFMGEERHKRRIAQLDKDPDSF